MRADYASQFHIVANLGGDLERNKRTLHVNRLKDAYTPHDQHHGRHRHSRRLGSASARRRPNATAASLLQRMDVTATKLADLAQQAAASQQQQGQPAAAHATAATAALALPMAGGGGGGGSAQPQLACNRTRRPMHVVMTAASGLYQEWQSRIAYYHYKKMKAAHPCSDLGGFTRLFNTYQAQPDSLMDEIPTVLVKQLGHGNCAECDRGFIVMNRRGACCSSCSRSTSRSASRRSTSSSSRPTT